MIVKPIVVFLSTVSSPRPVFCVKPSNTSSSRSFTSKRIWKREARESVTHQMASMRRQVRKGIYMESGEKSLIYMYSLPSKFSMYVHSNGKDKVVPWPKYFYTTERFNHGFTWGLLRKVSLLFMQPPALAGAFHSLCISIPSHVFWSEKKFVFTTRQMDMLVKYWQ